MAHVQHSRFAARSYELDSYRHLNNAVYVSWFEQARLEFLLSLGFSYDGFADRRQWIVVARTEVDFRRAVRLGDQLLIETRVQALGRSSVRFHQRMLRGAADFRADGPGAADSGTGDSAAAGTDPPGSELVCEALTVMVFSGEAGSSIPIPDDFRAALGPVGEV